MINNKDRLSISSSLLKYFNQDKDYTIHNKNDILNKLDWIDEDAWERMMKAKSKRINNRRRIRRRDYVLDIFRGRAYMDSVMDG